MPEAVTGVLDGAMDVVIVGLGLCCVWLGCRALPPGGGTATGSGP